MRSAGGVYAVGLRSSFRRLPSCKRRHMEALQVPEVDLGHPAQWRLPPPRRQNPELGTRERSSPRAESESIASPAIISSSPQPCSYMRETRICTLGSDRPATPRRGWETSPPALTTAGRQARPQELRRTRTKPLSCCDEGASLKPSGAPVLSRKLSGDIHKWYLSYPFILHTVIRVPGGGMGKGPGFGGFRRALL